MLLEIRTWESERIIMVEVMTQYPIQSLLFGLLRQLCFFTGFLLKRKSCIYLLFDRHSQLCRARFWIGFYLQVGRGDGFLCDNLHDFFIIFKEIFY
ncbi:MAG: hypothetical protein UW69_C0008G0004 [Microgenomates group bacterium GW2011_GWA2_44_7]|nr:MAG: hypothetical protein UW69_C0008G0004 [Microgenomates group bacterium GW2011_GWA2_44_7]